jgi:hypothetical protein
MRESNSELIAYALDYIENGTMPRERRNALQALVGECENYSTTSAYDHYYIKRLEAKINYLEAR